jgi:hypothetical protein
VPEIVKVRGASADRGEPVTCVVEIPKGSRNKRGWEAALLEIEESRRCYREHNSMESTAIGAQ